MSKREEERNLRRQQEHLRDRLDAIRWKYKSEWKEPASVTRAKKVVAQWSERTSRLRKEAESDWRQRMTQAREAIAFGPINKALDLVKKAEAAAVHEE